MKHANINLTQNEAVNRFEILIEDNIAFIEYKLTDSILFLTHTEVPSALEGKGVGSAIVTKTFDYAQEKGYKIVPLCSFIQKYLKRHPEWKDLVASNT